MEPESREIELTERGQYCLPRALELSGSLPDISFWDCLTLAQEEYDSVIQ